jgi:hypothetical protein
VTTNRTPISRPLRRDRITPAVINLFLRALDIQRKFGDDSHQALDSETQLDIVLGRMKPWQISPLQVQPSGPAPSWVTDGEPWKLEEWRQAQALRHELETFKPRTVRELLS